MRTARAFALLALLAGAAACSKAPDRPNPPEAPAASAVPATTPQAPGAPEAGAAAAPGAPAAAPQPASAPAAPAQPVIVDVRTQQEYDAGHVKGALLIPYDQMERRWQELEPYRNQPVVLYCRSGRRSGIALDVLKTRGFTQLENGGGIEAMASRGFTITKD